MKTETMGIIIFRMPKNEKLNFERVCGKAGVTRSWQIRKLIRDFMSASLEQALSKQEEK